MGKTINFDGKINVWKYVVTNVSRYLNYSLYGSRLQRVSSVKDLGITLTSDLNFKNHINSIVSKSYKMVGFLKRTCKSFSSVKALQRLCELCTFPWFNQILNMPPLCGLRINIISLKKMKMFRRILSNFFVSNKANLMYHNNMTKYVNTFTFPSLRPVAKPPISTIYTSLSILGLIHLIL